MIYDKEIVTRYKNTSEDLTQADEVYDERYAQTLTSLANSAGYENAVIANAEDYRSIAEDAYNAAQQGYERDLIDISGRLSTTSAEPLRAVAVYETYKDLYKPNQNVELYNRASDAEIAKKISTGNSVYDLADEEVLRNNNNKMMAVDVLTSSLLNEFENQSLAGQVWGGAGTILPYGDSSRLARMTTGGNKYGQFTDGLFKIVKGSLPGESVREQLGLTTLQKANREWLTTLAIDPNVSLEDFTNIIQAKNKELNDAGWSVGARHEFFQTALSPDVVTNKFIMGFETALIGGFGFASAVKGAGKEGFKGAVKGVVNEAIEQVPLAATGIKTTGYAISSPVKYLKTFGNKKAASEALADIIDASVTGSSSIFEAPEVSKLIAEEANPSALSAKPFADNIQVANEELSKTAKARAENYKATQSIMYTLGSKLNDMTDETINSYVRDITKEIASLNTLSDKKYQDIVSVRYNPADAGNAKVVVKLGWGEDYTKPFKKKQAEEYAKTLTVPTGMSKTIIQDQTGWYVQLGTTTDKGYGQIVYDTVADANKTGRTKQRGGLLSHVFQHTSTPRAQKQINETFIADKGVLRSYFKQKHDNIKTLSFSQKQELQQLVDISRAKEQWLDTDVLTQRGVSEKVIKGYENARDISDIEWSVTNTKQRKLLGEQGYKSLNFKVNDEETIDIIGRPLTNPISIKGSSVYDVNAKAPKEFVDSDFDNYLFYKVRGNINGFDTVMVKKGQQLESALPSIIVDYIPGFRHFYTPDTKFLKQVDVTSTGSLKSVRTFLADEDLGSLTTSMKELNEAIDITKKYLDNKLTKVQAAEQIEALSSKALKLNDFDEWMKLIQTDANPEGIISLNSKFEVVADGQRTSVENSLKNYKDIEKLTSDDVIAMNAYAYSDSQRYLNKLRRVSQGLTNADGIGARMIDIDTELNKSVNSIVNNMTTARYTQITADNFVREFASVLDESALVNYTPRQILISENVDTFLMKVGQVNPVTGEKITLEQIEAAKAAQRTYKIMMETPSITDIKIEGVFKQMAEVVGDSSIGQHLGLTSPGTRREAMLKSLSKSNPLKFWRALTFNNYLGFFNIKQLHLQALSSLNALAISPVAGAKAIGLTPSVMHALPFKTKTIIEDAARIAARATEDTSVTSTFMEQLVNNARYLDVFTPGSFSGAIENFSSDNVQKLMNWSQWSFRTGEYYNRVHSAVTAILEYQSTHPNVTDFGKLSKVELAKVIERQQTLYMNMGRGGVANVQTGVGTIITQMKGFSLRSLEALMDKSLTTAEKVRLASLNLALTGSKGMLGISAGTALYDYLDDDSETTSETYKKLNQVLYDGGVDYLARSMGHDVSYFRGQSFQWVDFIQDLIDFADSPLEQIPVYSSTGKIKNTFTTLWNVMSNSNVGVYDLNTWKSSLDILAEQKNLPSGLNNLWLGAMIWNTGRLYNSKGLLVRKDLTKVEAVAKMFGVSDITTLDEQAIYYRSMGSKEKIDNAVKNLAPLHKMMLRNNSKDDNAYYQRQFEAIRTVALKDFSERERQEVSKQLWKQNPLRDMNIDTKGRALKNIIKYNGDQKLLEDIQQGRIFIDVDRRN